MIVCQEEITRLFHRCLEENFHLHCFKNATLCILPKPGKRSRLLPLSYRLIALLVCRSKVLELFVPRLLAYLALEYKLIRFLYFAAGLW